MKLPNNREAKSSQPVAEPVVPTAERLQKLLAQQGFGSRREIETWIEEGRLTVNGTVAKLGTKVLPTDQIALNKRPITLAAEPEPFKVLLYHKPEGEVCTRHDPEGRPTVFSALPRLRQGRWVSVGRLDLNTSGLLLFTDDGELANRLMHPSYELEREYAVRVYGKVSPEIIQRLLQGVQLEDGLARFLKIEDAGGEGKNHWYRVVLTEGRNKEVRRLWESQNVVVSRLIRIRFANVHLPPRIRQGQTLELTLNEINALRQCVKLPELPPRPPAAKPRVAKVVRRPSPFRS